MSTGQELDDQIHTYRQPMVTATGIILGFVLGFTGKWATDDPAATDGSSANDAVSGAQEAAQGFNADYLVLVGLLIGIVLLITALWRILNNKLPTGQVGDYYHRTLKIFIAGVICSFTGVLAAIIQTMVS